VDLSKCRSGSGCTRPNELPISRSPQAYQGEEEGAEAEEETASKEPAAPASNVVNITDALCKSVADEHKTRKAG
jgi:hypothetical protein